MDPVNHARRRNLLLLGTAACAIGGWGPAVAAKTAKAAIGGADAGGGASAHEFGIEAGSPQDQSARLQAAIDRAAATRVALVMPAGRFVVGGLVLRPGSRLVGVPGATEFVFNGAGNLIRGGGDGIRIEGITVDGADRPLDRSLGSALVNLSAGVDCVVSDVVVRGASGHGLALTGVGGRVVHSRFERAKGAGLFSLDGAGLEIAHNQIVDCQDNGLLVWRSRHGDDRTLVQANRIQRIGNLSGGSGQYGNGISIYRADGVIVCDNQIAGCSYSAVRANEASNVSIRGNTASRIGEVAIYAEAAAERVGAAGFEGALIASNVVDTAAAGIVVTNFNNGGRLAVVQGNMVRNLFRRESEPRDKRGEGIAVEADAVVTGNVIENAPTAGIWVGWGRHMRDVVVSSNLVRRSRIGIAVSGVAGAGQCLIAHNMLSGASLGAIRAMDHDQPIGGDLAAGGKSPAHIQLSANVAQ